MTYPEILQALDSLKETESNNGPINTALVAAISAMQQLRDVMNEQMQARELYDLQASLGDNDWRQTVGISLTWEHLELILPHVKTAYGPDYDFRSVGEDTGDIQPLGRGL